MSFSLGGKSQRKKNSAFLNQVTKSTARMLSLEYYLEALSSLAPRVFGVFDENGFDTKPSFW